MSEPEADGWELIREQQDILLWDIEMQQYRAERMEISTEPSRLTTVFTWAILIGAGVVSAGIAGAIVYGGIRGIWWLVHRS